jgi:hypothetical protein
MALPAGTYTFVGQSPQWNAGAACPAVGPIVVTTPPGHLSALSVSVICPRM